jgi:hypothetical protein
MRQFPPASIETVETLYLLGEELRIVGCLWLCRMPASLSGAKTGTDNRLDAILALFGWSAEVGGDFFVKAPDATK